MPVPDQAPPTTTPPDRAVIRSARLSLFVLLSINLFNYIDRYILAAVEPRIREAFFAKDDPDAATKLGVLGSAFMISYMVIAPIFGWLGDRTRRWTIIGLGAIAWSLASGASGLATTFTALLITRVFVGIGEAAYGPTAPTIIADLYPVQRRGAVLAWFYAAIPVGTAIGYSVGTVVAAKTNSWQWPFYSVVPWGIALGIWATLHAGGLLTSGPRSPLILTLTGISALVVVGAAALLQVAGILQGGVGDRRHAVGVAGRDRAQLAHGVHQGTSGDVNGVQALFEHFAAHSRLGARNRCHIFHA